MADTANPSDSRSGESDSTSALWRTLKTALFGRGDGDQSLRAQLEEAIDEHEDDPGDAKGDLSPIERQMVRNLLNFCEHDADDVAIPRG